MDCLRYKYDVMLTTTAASQKVAVFLTSTLMMETELVSKTLAFNFTLSQQIDR
jgi:hypothetical protein